MTIRSAELESVITIPRDNIQRFEHSTELAGIGGIDADTQAPVISGGILSFTNLPAGSRVEVFDMAGRRMISEVAEGAYTLSLSQLGSGVFVVKVNNLTYKIANK